MSGVARAGAALLLASAIAAFVWFVAGDEQPSGADAPRWHSAAQCADCHREVYDEWHDSHHQIAFLNPEVRKLSDDFRNKECQACHLPRPVSLTGYEQRTLPRMTEPDEGISCITCHLGADGGILARHDRPDAPCAPRADDAFTTERMCASCHNQHKTTDQWRASGYAFDGVGCNDCHMPERTRISGRIGRFHGYPGAHDVDMLRAAATFTVEKGEGELRVAVTNSGAGHNFPTEERHRAVDVVVRFDDGEWNQVYRLRQPYRDEVGEDTQLPAGETVTIPVPIPPGSERATARLWYRLTPYIGDDDPRSTLLFEREVTLR